MPSQFLYPYVRFLNAAPDNGRVSFYVNNQEFFKDFPFGQISGYKQIPEGDVTFRAIWENGGENVIYTIQANVSAGDVLTLALAGETGSRTLVRINDVAEKNNFKAANVRIANLVSDYDGFDIYANGFPILEDIEFPEVSDYIMLRPNMYTFKVLSEDTDNVILNTGNQDLQARKYYTLYIIGNAENFRKQEGFLKTNQISKSLNLYRQNYCGCKFAKKI